jgi:hypothetical protein
MCHLLSSLARTTHAALFAGLLLLLSAEAQATTYSWTGSANASWSNAGNWSPNGVPANGDTLIFPAGTANKTNTNDLIGLELVDILVNDNGYPGYTLGGNGIVLTHSLISAGYYHP